jgi:hypothetical protein
MRLWFLHLNRVDKNVCVCVCVRARVRACVRVRVCQLCQPYYFFYFAQTLTLVIIDHCIQTLLINWKKDVYHFIGRKFITHFSTHCSEKKFHGCFYHFKCSAFRLQIIIIWLIVIRFNHTILCHLYIRHHHN